MVFSAVSVLGEIPPELIVRGRGALSWPAGMKAGPALILDRDGVLVEEKHHLSRPEDVVLSPGAVDVIRAVQVLGLPVCVVTNQSGIDRKLFTLVDFEAVSRRIDEELAQNGVSVDVTIACPFHPDFTPNYSEGHAYWRKPGPGMLHLLADRFGVDLGKSLFVGDNISDAKAGRAAGFSRSIHLLTGHGARFAPAIRDLSSPDFLVETVENLIACQELIVDHFRLFNHPEINALP